MEKKEKPNLNIETHGSEIEGQNADLVKSHAQKSDYSQTKKAYEAKHKKVTIRLNESEQKQVEKEMKTLKMYKMASYIKLKVLKEPEQIYQRSQDFIAFRREVIRMGTNLNQIAKQLNSPSGLFHSEDLARQVSELEVKYREIVRLK
jgi:hypothetical protein